MDSPAVTEAFRRSLPHVDRLRRLRGPWEKPAAPILEDVCAILWARQGKRLRSHLVYWGGELVGIPAERLHVYAWAAEALHTATLLHDDVIDRAETRRGKASANHVFDNTLPILSGDYLLSDAVQQVSLAGEPRVLQGLCRTLKDLVSGEALQYGARFSVPTLNQLERVAELKTASLLRWAISVGPHLAGRPIEPVERFAINFGKLYQFSDDLLDVVGGAGKPQWNDLREGKINYATWHLIQWDPTLQASFALERFSAAATLTRLNRIRAQLDVFAVEAERALDAFPDDETVHALRDLVRLCRDRCY